MANTTTFTVRIDADIKKQCETLYGELGINLTTAINVFLRQSIRAGGFPFDVRIDQPNRETIAAMLEAERISCDPSVKRYSDVEEALRALKDGDACIEPVAVYPKKYLDELRCELGEVKAKIYSGEQPVFDNIDALFEKLESD